MPCVLVAMLGMTTHSENLTRVQKELWYLIKDEDTIRVLEAMIDKMKELWDNSECFKQWREEAKAHIPTDKKYSLFNEKYWVAAYIIYINLEKFKELFKKLNSIKSKINSIENKLYKLEDEHKELRNKIEKLTKKLENSFFLYFVDDEVYFVRNVEMLKVYFPRDVEMLKNLKKELEKKLDKYEVILDRYYDLKDTKNDLLEKIIEIAEQLLTS